MERLGNGVAMQRRECLDAVLEAANQAQGREAIHGFCRKCRFGARLARIFAPKATVAVGGGA
jgi:hypothetical protein